LNPVGHESFETAVRRWVGEVPSHWQVTRLKNVADYWVSNVDKVAAEGEEPVRLCNYTDVYYNEHLHPNLSLMQTTATAAEIRRFHLQVGDVVITKDSEEWSDIAVPALVTDTAPDLVCGYHLAIVRPRQSRLYGAFLQRLFQAAGVNTQLQLSASGITRYSLPKSAIGEALIPLPPLDEQRATTDFLARKTAAIDALIAKKTRFIELLNEKRQALITHAVTKGLDPNVKMKDSGDKWLGQIPTQWDVVPSNRFFLESKERAREEDEHLSATQKYGVIPLVEFERLEGRQVTHAEKNLEQRKHVEVDNFVISMRSFEGGIERVKARGCVRSSYVALVADERAQVGFFSSLFKSSAYIQGLQATAMFIRDGQDLSYNNFRQVKLPFPSFDEQRRIADFLDREISKSSALIAKTEAAIGKLLEYRSSLISAAVTGKIDVRNYRPQEAAVLCQ
jgi:type I restriction enzyme S subunit